MYQRYILINGKKYGPYLYRSVRKGNKVISIFVKNISKKTKKKVKNEVDETK